MCRIDRPRGAYILSPWRRFLHYDDTLLERIFFKFSGVLHTGDDKPL